MKAEEYLLVCFSEECGELTKEISKVIRFGRSEQMTPDTPQNILRVQEELNDLLTVAWMCGLDISLHEEHREKKRKAVQKYLDYSIKLGIIS